MTARHIQHMTLDTGHSRRSYRGEVADEAIAALHDGLGIALSRVHHRVSIPGTSDYSMTATAGGKCLIVTAWRDDAPLVTLGVAGASQCGAHLWRLLHDVDRPPMPPLATSGRKCNDAFADDAGAELARILKEAARKLEQGSTAGVAVDVNGNKCGAWSLGK